MPTLEAGIERFPGPWQHIGMRFRDAPSTGSDSGHGPGGVRVYAASKAMLDLTRSGPKGSIGRDCGGPGHSGGLRRTYFFCTVPTSLPWPRTWPFMAPSNVSSSAPGSSFSAWSSAYSLI